MTPIGNSLLEECVSEINEKITDDKNKLYLEQSKNVGYMFWKGMIYVPSAFFLGIWIAATALIIFGLTDIKIYTAIRNATDQEIASVVWGVLYFGIVSSIFLPVFIAIKYYRNKRDERVWADHISVWDKRDRINLIEEVLIRHGLINNTAVELNDEKSH